MNNEIELKTTFFEAIKNSNVGEIVKIFRKPAISPWEFKEKESGFNGILI